MLVVYSNVAWRKKVSSKEAIADLGLTKLPPKLRVLVLGVDRSRSAKHLDVYLKMPLEHIVRPPSC